MSVPLAALSVFTYQGTITLLASFLGGLTDAVIGEIAATGGVQITGLGIVKRLRAANYLPASSVVVAILTMMGVGF